MGSINDHDIKHHNSSGEVACDHHYQPLKLPVPVLDGEAAVGAADRHRLQSAPRGLAGLWHYQWRCKLLL